MAEAPELTERLVYTQRIRDLVAAKDFGKDKITLEEAKSVGLSKATLTKYYGDPERKNLTRSGSRYCLLYDVEKLIALGKKQAVLDAVAATTRRSAVGKAVAEVKIDANIAELEQIRIHVQVLEPAKLRKQAIQSWERWNDDRWRGDDEAHTLRITANYVRHHLTRYENLLDGIVGKYGRSLLYELLRDRVMDEVYRVYPHLRPANVPVPKQIAA